MDDENQRKFSTVVLCLLVYFSTGLNDTFWTSFFPTEFEDHGISKTTIGIIASSYNFSGLIFSIIMLFLKVSDMRKILFCAGNFITGIGCVAFGLLGRSRVDLFFIVMCIVTRSVMGIGSTMVWCAGAPLMISLFPRFTGRICSAIQASASAGIILGPPVGSVLFAYGGYALPFWVVGLIQMALAVLCFAVAPETRQTTRRSTENPSFRSVFEFLRTPGVLCLSVASIFLASSLGYIAVAFAPHLSHSYNISGAKTGIYFLPYTIFRAAMSPMFGFFIDKGFGGFVFGLFGCFTSIVSFAALGVSKYISCLKNIYFLESFTGLLGISSSAGFAPLILLFSSACYLRGLHNIESVADYASTMCYICFTTGLIIGQSVVGGFLYQHFGFFNSCLISSLLNLLTASVGMSYLLKHKLIFRSPLVDRLDSSSNEETQPIIC